jgi:hypothetical protein
MSEVEVTVKQVRRSAAPSPTQGMSVDHNASGNAIKEEPSPSNGSPLAPSALPDGNCNQLDPTDPTRTVWTETLKVGTQRRQASTADGAVTATIVGNFAASKPPIDLADHYLVVPELLTLEPGVAESHPQLPSMGKMDDWLLIPREAFAPIRAGEMDQSITLAQNSGESTECDKIGVSYKAFSFQDRPCHSPKGSCAFYIFFVRQLAKESVRLTVRSECTCFGLTPTCLCCKQIVFWTSIL